MVPAGCRLGVGQPAMRTVPPLTTAAARNGTALDRSGSTSQCRAAMVPAPTRQRLGVASSTSTPACRSIATVIAMCGADGTEVPVCTIVNPSVNAAPDSIRPDTNCDDDDASISTMPAAYRTGACHRERHGVPAHIDAQRAKRIQQRCDGAGPGLLVAVELDHRPAHRRHRRHEPQHGAGQSAVHPGAVGGGQRAGDGQFVGVAVDGQAQRAHGADHQIGVPAAQCAR